MNQAQKEPSNGTYTLPSRPRTVQTRSKYREPAAEQNEDLTIYGNIMYDRRVVRGNTYAQQTLPITVQQEAVEIREQEARRRAVARSRRAREQLRAREHLRRTRTPEPIEGRTHIDVQTELYLEEMSDHVEAVDMHCQTDDFLDRPPTPLFIPAKSGMDVATQIEEGELFDFDVEVEPLLEVLVGKTLEQALLEVMEEEEMACLRAQQRAFQELRNAELAEAQRLEEQERRHREEKEHRIAQKREVLEKERETVEKIAARAFAQHFLAGVLTTVNARLWDGGFFYDPVQRDIETNFFPWLMAEVHGNLERRSAARVLLDTLILDGTQKRLDSFQKLES